MTMSCVISIKHLKWRNLSEQIVNEIKKKSVYFKQKIFIQVIFTLHHCFHIDIHHRCHSHPTVITVWVFTNLLSPLILAISFCTTAKFSTSHLSFIARANVCFTVRNWNINTIKTYSKNFESFIFVMLQVKSLHVIK